MTAKNASELEYADVSLSYRAPRVAIIINGDHEWIYLARLAIYAACGIWGGSGFVLVPYRKGGVVDPVILRAVRAYDPDYVVTLPITVAQFDAIVPGTIDDHMKKVQREGFEPDVIESLRADLVAREMPVAEDRKARELVVSACSTYRMAMGSDADVSRWSERAYSLNPHGTGLGPFTPVERFRNGVSPRFGARADMNTPLGLLTASRVGLINEPKINLSADPAVLRDDESLAFTLLSLEDISSIRSNSAFFERSGSVGAEEEPLNAWAESQTELVPVSDYKYNPVVYVVGSEPEDFCLAFLWQRLYGRALWLADELWSDDVSQSAMRNRQSVAHGIRNLARRASGLGTDRVFLTSVSKELEATRTFLDLIDQTPPMFALLSELGKPLEDVVDIIPADQLSYPSQGKNFLGLAQQFHWTDTMPVIRDPEGGLTLAGTPPPPVLKAPGLGKALVSHHIDLDFPSVAIPQAKAVPPAALVRSSENPFERYDVWVRSSRRGLSYESLRHGFVQAGILDQESLGRPRVRKPGMLTWARWKAEMAGYELQVSDAGWPSHILAGLAGGRRVLAEAFSGALHPALLEFKKRQSGTQTEEVFDNKKKQKGCVLNGIVYLTLAGFSFLSGQSVEEARKAVDKLLAARILTRGLVLRCTTCRTLSFYSIEVVGQTNACPRCGNAEQLRHELWRFPNGEPDWFYDLHALGRDLVQNHGDVPLLLSAYLGAQLGNRYSDTPEIVLRAGKKTVVEADLVAIAGESLVVAEVKSSDNLGIAGAEETRSVRLRLKLCEIFDADEIVCATTADLWKAHTLSAICAEWGSYDWPHGLKPKLRIVTALGPGGKGVEQPL